MYPGVQGTRPDHTSEREPVSGNRASVGAPFRNLMKVPNDTISGQQQDMHSDGDQCGRSDLVRAAGQPDQHPGHRGAGTEFNVKILLQSFGG